VYLPPRKPDASEAVALMVYGLGAASLTTPLVVVGSCMIAVALGVTPLMAGGFGVLFAPLVFRLVLLTALKNPKGPA
jgi:hypothetical protein